MFQIDGTFRINTPSVLLGYTYDIGQGGGDASEVPIGRSEDITYLSLFITIEPPLAQPDAVGERVRRRTRGGVGGGWGGWVEDGDDSIGRKTSRTSDSSSPLSHPWLSQMPSEKG